MTGQVTFPNGSAAALPPFSEWEILRTDGDGCDSFSVTFPAEAADFSTLQKALRFQAFEDGKTVFTGVVDEVTLTLDGKGRRICIDGRGLGALLLDNQLRGSEFQSAQLPDVLRLCTEPFGIRVRAGALGAIPGFSIDSGDTCRQALWGFVRHAGGGLPRFAADGTLLIGQPGGTAQISDADGVWDVRYSRCRYGVLSEVVEVSASARGGVNAVSAPDYDGLPHRKVTVVSGKTLRAERRTAAEWLAESSRNEWELQLTLSGAFRAEPGDECRVSLQNAGIFGTFTVRSVCSRASNRGVTCTLTMGGS